MLATHDADKRSLDLTLLTQLLTTNIIPISRPPDKDSACPTYIANYSAFCLPSARQSSVKYALRAYYYYYCYYDYYYYDYYCCYYYYYYYSYDDETHQQPQHSANQRSTLRQVRVHEGKIKTEYGRATFHIQRQSCLRAAERLLDAGAVATFHKEVHYFSGLRDWLVY